MNEKIPTTVFRLLIALILGASLAMLASVASAGPTGEGVCPIEKLHWIRGYAVCGDPAQWAGGMCDGEHVCCNDYGCWCEDGNVCADGGHVLHPPKAPGDE